MIYRCHPQVMWAVQSHGLILIRRDIGAVLRLNGSEASLWDLMSRYAVWQDVRDQMCVILRRSPEDVAEWAGVRLEAWTRDGWLSKT